MEYLSISNVGELDIRLISLMGASTKRGMDGKIGKFGTGMKYSVAWLLRNNIDFKVFIGTREVKFTLVHEDINGKEFGIVCIDGIQTSLTTSMGLDWMGWMIVREIFCNAKDEGEEIVLKSQGDNLAGVDGRTTFHIQLTGDIKETYDNWNQYFLDESTALQSDERFAIYPGQKNLRIYKHGILVGDFPDEKRSVFCYDIKDCSINELRQYIGYRDWDISRIIGKLNAKNVESLIQQVNGDKKETIYESGLDYEYFGCSFTGGWKEVVGTGSVIAEKDYENLNQRGVLQEEGTLIQLPNKMAGKLCQDVPHVSAVRVVSKVKSFHEVHNSELDMKIKSALSTLEVCGYQFHPELKIITGVFGDASVFGCIQIDEKLVMLSDELSRKSMFSIITTLVEENEHFLSGFEDTTRQFQQHFIDLYTKKMLDLKGINL